MLTNAEMVNCGLTTCAHISFQQAFDVGPAANQTRVGVASFSTENKVNFELNQHKTNSAVLSAVDDIEYMGFGTYTREGIDLVRTSMFTEDAGMRADDAAIPRVLIIVTDGQSNQGHSPIVNARYDSWSTWSIDAETLFDGSAADKLHEAGRKSKSIYWFSPRICSRTPMGYSDPPPIRVLSRQHPATFYLC